ncbi:MAG: hypothetical protein SGI92_09065 [Bryobacteraceae bacterium]|nr:hypothetical protein [Bryobacteraceae bacterium]
MTRSLLCLLFATLLLATNGCKKAGENKEAVRDGVLQHLSKNAALDVNSLTIDVTDIKFQGDEATAAVSIKPKSAPEQGMSMSYTLVRKGDKWEVKGKAAGHGGGGAMGAAPPTDPPPASGTPEPKGALGDAPKAPAAGGGDLPPGHPPVNTPPTSKK